MSAVLLNADFLGRSDRGRLLKLMVHFDCCNAEKNGGGLYRCSDLLTLCGHDLGTLTVGSRLYKRLSRKFNHFSKWNFGLALDLLSSSFALVGYRDVVDVKLDLSMEVFANVCVDLATSYGVFYKSFGTFGLYFSLSVGYEFLWKGRHKAELIKSYFNNKLG